MVHESYGKGVIVEMTVKIKTHDRYIVEPYIVGSAKKGCKPVYIPNNTMDRCVTKSLKIVRAMSATLR